MADPAFEIATTNSELLLVKDNLAAFFREAIISGRLAPGEKIVEVRWAKRLGMSQTSVREAINILSAEGFVQKASSRTANVTKLSNKDVQNSYELRAVLEGYAARIVTEKLPDLSHLEQSLADMHSAIACGNLRAFYERDLQFHVLLAELTGNKMLVQALKRIVIPLFAFVVIRVQGTRTDPQQWERSFEQHRRIIEALKSGDSAFAERLVIHIVSTFFEETQAVFRPAQQ
jgi:DNA-binding GntR family transcriptional regulator